MVKGTNIHWASTAMTSHLWINKAGGCYADGHPSFCRHGFTPDVISVNDGGAAELVQGGVYTFFLPVLDPRYIGKGMKSHSLETQKAIWQRRSQKGGLKWRWPTIKDCIRKMLHWFLPLNQTKADISPRCLESAEKVKAPDQS